MRTVLSSELKPRNVKEKRFGVLKIHNVSAIRHFTIELAKYFKDIETSADWDQLLFTIL